MRKWVEYNFDEDQVTNIDKKRLLKRAIGFQNSCEESKGGRGVSNVFHYYQPYLEAALKCKIDVPQTGLPITDEMHNNELPKNVEDALTYFRIALESRPAVYGVLDAETLHFHRDKFIKEEDGIIYILEYFEDDE